MHSETPIRGGAVWFFTLALFVFLALVHFSLPTIVTFDSAHYHVFLPILTGRTPFSEWDIVRGPVFPFLLLLSKKLFGFASHGFITCTSLFYMLTAWTALQLLLRNSPVFKLSGVCAIVGTLLVAIDPLVLGYYHTMLTEFVAATIFIVSVFLALEWIRLDSSELGVKNALICGWFVVSLPISYLLKQPYVTASALPLIGAFLVSLVRLPPKREVAMRSVTVGVSLISLYMGIFLWESVLPVQAKEKYVGRSSAALLSNQVIQGLRGLAPVVASGQTLPSDPASLPNLPSAIADEFRSVAGPDSCSQLLRARNESGYIVYHCFSGSVLEALRFVVKNVFNFPLVTIRGYARSYLEIARAKELRLFGFREHEPIAYRLFAVGPELSNIFHISNPHLESLVRGYRIDQEAIPGGVIGRSSYRLFGGISLWLFTWTIVSAPLLLILSALCLVRRPRSATSILGAPRELLQAICVINFCITIHIAIHAFLMAIIDRYGFPIYPIALINLFLIVGWLVSIALRRVRA